MTSSIRKRSRILIAFLSFLTALTVAHGEASEQEALEAQNLEKAIHCMELLEVVKDLDQFCLDCLGDIHVEHSPWIEDSKEALIEAFERKFEKYPEFTAKIVRAGADGDLVWIHMNTKRTPDDRGNAVVNIFRMNGGKFVEHWSVVQPVPEHSKNDNTMF